MRLTVLGSLSGTEPQKGRHHTSLMLEGEDGITFFDAGEGCAHSAHLSGVDLLCTKNIIISHCHIDHTGGLANLLWTIRKLEIMTGKTGQDVNIYIPDLQCLDAVLAFLRSACGGFLTGYRIHPYTLTDGILPDTGAIKVTAQHTHHLGTPGEGEPYRAFGFRVEGGNAPFIYTGDTKGYADWAPLYTAEIAHIFHETGHHHPDVIASDVRALDGNARLCFMHHGRDFLNSYDKYHSLVNEILPSRVSIAEDGSVYEV